jgi:hypothetical protein
MRLLDALRSGNASLVDPDTGDDLVSELTFGEGDFWPNDKTIVEPDSSLIGVSSGDPLRFFNMDEVF